MEFRLIYRGPLKADGGPKLKHEIRKEFHKQLAELWKQHPDLRQQSEQYFMVTKAANGEQRITAVYNELEQLKQMGAKTWLEHVADNHARIGYRFVPLISKVGGFTCALDILFLRRGIPGNVIGNGGDIDNRIKTLFDGFRMPDTLPELGGYEHPDPTENPFFCLLEDDNLITKISVTTDRLMTPLDPADERPKDVHLIIHVTITNPSAIFAGNRLV